MALTHTQNRLDNRRVSVYSPYYSSSYDGSTELVRSSIGGLGSAWDTDFPDVADTTGAETGKGGGGVQDNGKTAVRLGIDRKGESSDGFSADDKVPLATLFTRGRTDTPRQLFTVPPSSLDSSEDNTPLAALRNTKFTKVSQNHNNTKEIHACRAAAELDTDQKKRIGNYQGLQLKYEIEIMLIQDRIRLGPPKFQYFYHVTSDDETNKIEKDDCGPDSTDQGP